VERTEDLAGLASIEDVRGDAGRRDFAHRLELRFHSTHGLRALVWTNEAERLGDVADFSNPLAIRVLEAIDTRQNDQIIRLGENRDLGGKPVVVAKSEFLHRNGVIFIDDRNRSALEQAVERVAGIVAAHEAIDVAVREEKLGDGESVFFK